MRNYVSRLCLLALIMCSCVSSHAQKVSKQTYIYAIKDADTLRLDKYSIVTNKADTLKSPVVLFAFGGGFTGGNRADKRYIPYFMFLVKNGFTVVSIDYRTKLKDVELSKMATVEGFASALTGAVGAAVEDYLTATAFVIKQCNAWKINTQQIVACGSSAGAITVLQTEYMICNGGNSDGMLPQGFNYAGLVSFAGAIMSVGEPKWNQKPCPMMLFHGDADKRVPFRFAGINGMGLYGSQFLQEQLSTLGASYHFYKAAGMDHSVAITPMQDNKDDIIGFLHQMVTDNKIDYQITTTRTTPELTGYKTDFTLEDYIQENMKP